MIDPAIKRSLGQMIKGVQVVAATHDGLTRAYTSHWVTQVSFAEPVVMACPGPPDRTPGTDRWGMTFRAHGVPGAR